MLTPLVHLQQGNVTSLFATRKSQKIKKVDENSYYWRKKIFIFSERVE